MKKNRVECCDCQHLIQAVFEDDDNLISKMVEKPKCELGKRIMFRKPNSYFDNDYGYIRYCNDFKQTE